MGMIFIITSFTQEQMGVIVILSALAASFVACTTSSTTSVTTTATRHLRRLPLRPLPSFRAHIDWFYSLMYCAPPHHYDRDLGYQRWTVEPEILNMIIDRSHDNTPRMRRLESWELREPRLGSLRALFLTKTKKRKKTSLSTFLLFFSFGFRNNYYPSQYIISYDLLLEQTLTWHLLTNT